MWGSVRINVWMIKKEKKKILLCAACRGKRWEEMRRMYFATQQSFCSTVGWKSGEILLLPWEKWSKCIKLRFSRNISAVKKCFIEWRMSDSQSWGRVVLVWWAAWTPANTTHQNQKPFMPLISAGNNKKKEERNKERRENVNGTEHYSAPAGEAAADPPGVRVKMFCCANVDRPQPCECFLWCPRSSAPDPVVPARWAVSQGCRTPPDTKNKIK